MGLKGNKVKIFVSPNRPNLRISVIKLCKDSALDSLMWIVDMVEENCIETPKTLVFCNSTKDIALLISYLLFRLGKKAFVPVTTNNMEDCVIGIYHSLTWPNYKERVLRDMKSFGKKRVVLATSALSMGVNFSDVRYVVHWGPARNILDHQQSGRAGRDGRESDVVVFYYGQQLSQCEPEVKEFVKSDHCLRVASYRSLDPDIQPSEPGHDCCSNCKITCFCSGNTCNAPVLPFSKDNNSGNSESSNNETLSRPVNSDDKEDLKAALIEIKDEGKELMFGNTFSMELIEDILERSNHIFTLHDLMNTCPVFSICHALKVLEIFSDIFEDISGLEETIIFFQQHQLPGLEQQTFYQNYIGYFDSADSDESTSSDELDS